MPANLSAPLVSNIKKLNAIPELLERLKYLCESTNMGLVGILAPHMETWAVCAVYNALDENINLGTAFQFNNTTSNQHLKENIAVIENGNGIEAYNAVGKLTAHKINKAITAPIHRSNGKFFGLLCAMDTGSNFTEGIAVHEIYNFHSRVLGTSIELAERFDEVNYQLKHEREKAEKNATFIAILAHDLRNPVATVRMCSDIILKAGPNSVVSKNAEIIKLSSYRMQELIDSMLDTAQGRFGEGIKIEKKVNNVLLANALYHVVDEIMAVNYLEIQTSLKLTSPVNCDVERIAQLASNLLSNAVHHGDGKNILMNVRTIKDAFVLTVSNTGPTIPKAKQKKIFEPYYSDFTQENKRGLGLGLYISAQIAQSHGGSLKVRSKAGVTKFILTIPCS